MNKIHRPDRVKFVSVLRGEIVSISRVANQDKPDSVFFHVNLPQGQGQVCIGCTIVNDNPLRLKLGHQNAGFNGFVGDGVFCGTTITRANDEPYSHAEIVERKPEIMDFLCTQNVEFKTYHITMENEDHYTSRFNADIFATFKYLMSNGGVYMYRDESTSKIVHLTTLN